MNNRQDDRREAVRVAAKLSPAQVRGLRRTTQSGTVSQNLHFNTYRALARKRLIRAYGDGYTLITTFGQDVLNEIDGTQDWMPQKLRIEKGIDNPQRLKSMAAVIKEALTKMEPGDSFLVPFSYYASVGPGAAKLGLKMACQMISADEHKEALKRIKGYKKVTEVLYRVWLVGPTVQGEAA